MFAVRETDDAKADVKELLLGIQLRIQALYQRLTRWSNVSGYKAFRDSLHGAYRLRTGDYRILFRVEHEVGRIVVFRIAHRRDVYDLWGAL